MARLALLLYTVLIYLLRPLLLLFFLLRSKADRAYRQRFAERFCAQQVPASARGGILLHAVSVGEVVAATPLIEALLSRYPQLPLTVTCTTPTGSARIRQRFGDRVYHCYLPFDTPGANRRLFGKLAPQLLILLETELWPQLLAQAERQQVPVLLVNARLSARSARGYSRLGWLVKPMLARLTAVLAQDNASARRFNLLAGRSSVKPVIGAQQPLATVAGNLKFEMVLPADLATQAAALRAAWQQRPVLVAGSTHAGEDEQLLAAFAQLRAQLPDLLLILVPRHPDRFDTVARLIDTTGLPFARRSRGDVVSAQTAVLLGDTMGELLLWYQTADLVFIGGSLIERGGHNPLEAMCLAKPVLSGPHVFNFAKAFGQLKAAQAVTFVDNAQMLAQAVLTLWQQPGQRAAMAERGLALYQQQSGASQHILQTIEDLPLADVVQSSAAQTDWFSGVVPAAVRAADWADPAYWQQQQAVTGHSTGRNTVYFIEEPQTQAQWVLRHYYRGGLIGKLNRDWFWSVPLAASRAMAEFRLLRWMRAQQLPVPEPVAARCRWRGWGYSADILIGRISGAVDLFHYLQQNPLSAAQWQQLGALVARFQQAGVYHSDLNCHNLLIDGAGQFWLIDFDKCARRDGQHWWPEPVARLQRSLQKEQAKLQGFHFTQEDWQQLLQGYQAAMGQSQVVQN